MLVQESVVTEVPLCSQIGGSEEREEHSIADLLFRQSGRISRSEGQLRRYLDLGVQQAVEEVPKLPTRA